MCPTDAVAAPQDSPFWRFSLAFYARPGVAEACLELQDTCGIDVNILLFLLWLSADRRCLSPDAVRSLDNGTRDWREGVVVPLRTLRRTLKQDARLVTPDSAESIRIKVKAMELEAERLQQGAMYALADSLPLVQAGSSAEAARHNIAAYQDVLSQTFPAANVEALLRPLEEVLPPPAH